MKKSGTGAKVLASTVSVPDEAAPIDVERDKVTQRLARVAGHAASLGRMWENGTECKEMLTQIAAVRAALDQVGKIVLEHHIDHCVGEAIARGRSEEAVRDLKGALDRFV